MCQSCILEPCIDNWSVWLVCNWLGKQSPYGFGDWYYHCYPPLRGEITRYPDAVQDLSEDPCCVLVDVFEQVAVDPIRSRGTGFRLKDRTREISESEGLVVDQCCEEVKSIQALSFCTLMVWNLAL